MTTLQDAVRPPELSRQPLVEVEDLHFAYVPGKPVFDGFSWRVHGEPWAIIGPSGCGKSTLLYLLAGLRKPLAGSITVSCEQVQRPRHATGLILQDYGLLPWLTARENVMLGMRIRGLERNPTSLETVDLWLGLLGLEELAARYPAQLSGGQRQRVAIARTLALDPDLLLMDEPFSSLDAITREGLQDLVVSLGVENRATMLLVTHNIEEAVYLARRILVLPLPPIRRASVFDNPGGGSLGYRQSAEYASVCAAVRAEIVRVQSQTGSEVESD